MLLPRPNQSRTWISDLKSAFPEKALTAVFGYANDTKHLRCYKYISGNNTSFETKFKKDRFKYSIEFDANGVLEDVGFVIKPTDIPDGKYSAVIACLNNN